MTALFSRWLPCITLASWSTILLHFAQAPKNALARAIADHTFLLSGRVESFLVPAFRPYVLVAGLVLLGMALAFLFFPADAECCSASECGHPLSRFGGGKWVTFLVLLVPVGAAAVVTPDSFSRNVAKNRGIVEDYAALGILSIGRPSVPPELPLPTNSSSGEVFDDSSVETPNGSASTTPATTATTSPAPATAEPKDYLKRTQEGYIEAEVLDLIYAAQDAGLRKDFEGKKVTLTAQLMPDANSTASSIRFKAVRMFMTCCAADARPVATLIETEKLPELPEMSWVTVVGKATFPVEKGRRVALIQAESVSKAEPPAESMLY